MPYSALVTVVRAEYLEMPGMRLTLAQAQRFWGFERDVCRTVLAALVATEFLCVEPDGTYALVAGRGVFRPRAAKAGIRAHTRNPMAS